MTFHVKLIASLNFVYKFSCSFLTVSVSCLKNYCVKKDYLLEIHVHLKLYLLYIDMELLTTTNTVF